MNLQIRPFSNNDMEDIVRLSLLAWEPVFRSFQQVLGAEIYTRLHPDWKKEQKETVEQICKDEEKTTVWVADVDAIVVGFIAYTLYAEDKTNAEEKTGEVQLLAVHPAYQNRGIGTELNNFALQKMKEGGMRLAVVGTGGDPGHAPARRSYEKAGYTALPIVRYIQAL